MKLTASVKRIVWAIGWYLVWTFNDLMLVLKDGSAGNMFYQVVMFLIWLIPLLLFKDDKERK